MPRLSDPQRAGRRWCIVADDLTGSCDAGVHFARRGMTVAVTISGSGRTLPLAQVVVINTDSRCMEAEAAAERVRLAFCAMDVGGAALFKKIDSLLRGHVALEIGAALEASECDVAVVAPALPVLGRTMAEGRVTLPSGKKIDVAEALSSLTPRVVPTGEIAQRDLVLAAIRDARERGTKAICFDAESDAHLDQIVALGQASGIRILWVGSAGLAAAVARASEPVAAKRAAERRAIEEPVLFGVGSDHDTTIAQIRVLRENGHVLECTLDTSRIDDVHDAVIAGRNVLLRLPPCGIDFAKILDFVRAAPLSAFGGIVLTGGDTASRFLQAVGAHTLEVCTEVMPGVPASVVHGGIADGMSVITKSGAFGPADVFQRCADFLGGTPRAVEEGARL